MFFGSLHKTFRHLIRERANSLMNILGLTLGITSSLILFLMVRQGNQFDRYHEKADRIYRMVTSSKGSQGESFTQATPPILASTLPTEFPEVEEVVFTSYRRNNLIGIVNPDGSVTKHKEANGVVFTQNSFFKVFDRKLLSGNEKQVLTEPGKALLSKAWADKYFANGMAVGREIQFNEVSYEIEGIVEDYPVITDLPFDLLLSYPTVQRKMEDERGWGNLSDEDNTYFLLREGNDIASVNVKLPDFVTKYYGIEGENADGNKFIVQSLKDIHSDMRFSNYNTRMPVFAQIAFMVIGLFILFTCCINFINLTTASAAKRNKEIGIRKVLGSSRYQLILQLLSESLLVTMIACALSILTVASFLPLINNFMDFNLSMDFVSDYMIWVYLISIVVGVTMASGLYPAWLISGGKAGQIISGTIRQSSSGLTLRRSLIVTQFFISQFFIIATLVIYQQFQHLQQRNMGFIKDAIINVPIPAQEKSDPIQKASTMKALKSEILRLSGVETASLNFSPPASNTVVSSDVAIPGKAEQISTQIKEVDGDYLKLFGLELLAGTGLSDLDTMNGFVVNEAFAKAAGFQNYEEMVGQQMDLWGNNIPVRGVVKDFSSTSPSDAVRPLVMVNNLNGFKNLSLKLSNPNFQEDLKSVQSLWEKTYPDYIFEYSFLDNDIENLYKGERKTSRVVALFSGVSIFIGCLGLFALVTYMANNRTKEIGVRKVLGATVPNIIWLFSKEFIRLILIGYVIATPLAAFVMSKILNEFAYKITLGPLLFVTALLVTILIAGLTVGYRTFSAAVANPADALRSE